MIDFREELSAGDATKQINAAAADAFMQLSLTFHAKERMRDRGLIVSDVLHVLKTGFVYDAPERATRPQFWKYQIEGASPNSHGRLVRIVVIPAAGPSLKIVTVMWKDER